MNTNQIYKSYTINITIVWWHDHNHGQTLLKPSFNWPIILHFNPCESAFASLTWLSVVLLPSSFGCSSWASASLHPIWLCKVPNECLGHELYSFPFKFLFFWVTRCLLFHFNFLFQFCSSSSSFPPNSTASPRSTSDLQLGNSILKTLPGSCLVCWKNPQPFFGWQTTYIVFVDHLHEDHLLPLSLILLCGLFLHSKLIGKRKIDKNYWDSWASQLVFILPLEFSSKYFFALSWQFII